MDLDIKKDLTSNWFKLLQEAICNDINELENHKTKFISNTWKRNPNKDEGGGEYRILRNGKVFDKVGVNFSKGVYVGDKITDLKAAIKIKAKPILVKTGYGEETLKKLNTFANKDLKKRTKVFENLLEFAESLK